MTFSLLGIDTENSKQVTIPKSSRLQGLYIIGAPGTGKTGLIENLIVQDIEQGIGVCLLDPHGDLTQAVLARLPSHREDDVIFLDIADEASPFGVNLFACPDLTKESEIQRTLSQVLHVFEKSYGISPTTPQMYDYLYNCAYTLIVNPGATMIELRLLLTSELCRRELLKQVHNADVLTFWEEYHQMKPQEQREERRHLLNKLNDFSHAPLRTIVGQSTTTIDFRKIMDERKILLVKLDARLENASSLIGSVIVAQLLNAAYSRADLEMKKRKQFHLYADEFQRFATEDFATLLTEARKFGVGVSLAHQMRDQLDHQNRGATLNVVNLVIFKVSGPDAQELASQFDATPPPAELRPEPKMTPVRDVIGHLVRVGHPNPHVNTFVKHWKLMKLIEQPFAMPLDLDDDLRKKLGKQYGERVKLQDELNSFLFEIMSDGQPRKHVLSLPLFEWIVRTIEFDFFDKWQFLAWALDEKRIVTNSGATTAFYSRAFRGRSSDYYCHEPRDYVSFLLRRDVTAQEKDAFSCLWEAENEARLQQAFREFEQTLRAYLYHELTEALKEFFFWLYEWVYDLFDADDGREPQWCMELRMRRKQPSSMGVYPLLSSHASIEKKEAMLGVSFLSIPFENLRWEKREHENTYPYWHIARGQLEQLDSAPLLATEIEKIITGKKPSFEAFVREFREVVHTLAEHPITARSGIDDLVPGIQRTYQDVQNEIASRLANLPRFTARVKIAEDVRTVEHTVQTDEPKRGLRGIALQEQRERIQARNRAEGFTRKREAVAEEIRIRQEQYTQSVQQQQAPLSRRKPVLVCPKCQAEYRQGAKFCNQCGGKI